jgi:hypothetical protein
LNLFCISVEVPFNFFGVKACLSFGDVVLDVCVLIVVDCTCVTSMVLLKEFLLFFKFIFCDISGFIFCDISGFSSYVFGHWLNDVHYCCVNGYTQLCLSASMLTVCTDD